MLLAVSLGNTNISYGLFEAGQIVRHDKLPAADLTLLADRVSDERITQIIAASVTPSKTDQTISLLAMRFSTPVLLAGRDIPYAIEIQCDDPGKVGADRLLNAIAAFARTHTTTVIADIGTAVTVDLVSARGTFCGGAIAPGPGTMLRALHRDAELLPEVRFEEPPSPVGKNTTDAMRSGAFWGTAGLVEKLFEHLGKDQGGNVQYILTGGYAEMFAEEIRQTTKVVPELTLEGLAILAGRTGS